MIIVFMTTLQQATGYEEIDIFVGLYWGRRKGMQHKTPTVKTANMLF